MGREDPHFLSDHGHPAVEKKNKASDKQCIYVVGKSTFSCSVTDSVIKLAQREAEKPPAASRYHRWAGLFTENDR